MATYKKLKKNPLGLGTITITDSSFSDDNFDAIAKKKLKNALRVGLAEEMKVEEPKEVEEVKTSRRRSKKEEGQS